MFIVYINKTTNTVTLDNIIIRCNSYTEIERIFVQNSKYNNSINVIKNYISLFSLHFMKNYSYNRVTSKIS